jgi:L-lactate dehydrogenase complex protein LldG
MPSTPLSAVDLHTLFKQKAELVSAIVSNVATTREAFEYCFDLCERKQSCQLLISGCDNFLSQEAEALCDLKQEKIIAAPALPPSQAEMLKKLCADRGIRLVTDGLRQHLSGIDIGVTLIDYGIAETGTLVLDSSSEDVRLSTMVSEIHVGILPLSKIRPSAYDLEEELQEAVQTAPGYLAFITGASRTADIERVLAIGVHGPLELHILLLEDD